MKVTVIAPRTDYKEVARALAQFGDFHPTEEKESNFDPVLQELDVKAVRLFALADQAVKDLGLTLMPGIIDVVFRGVKIPRSEFEAEGWDDLLNKAEAQLNPIVEEVRSEKILLQKIVKEETDAQTLREAIQAVSGFSADLGKLPSLHRLKVVVAIVQNESLEEFSGSMAEAIFLSQPLTETQSLVLVAVPSSEGTRIEKVMEALEVKPLVIPSRLPQNPSEAYRKLGEEYESAKKGRTEVETRIERIKEKNEVGLLAIRELTEVARETLDEARASGGLRRLATISGYIPANRETEFKSGFGTWMVYSEPAEPEENGEKVPTLLDSRGYMRPFELITSQQGAPGHEEVDPTPLVSFVFPLFFGLMFADFGDGLIVTLIALLIRQRGKGSLRQWGNIFLVAGCSATIFGVLFGEFFGFSLYRFIPIPPVIEVMQTPFEGVPTPNITNIQVLMAISIIMGIAHLTTGIALDVYDAVRANEKVEALVVKIPTLTMYLSGVGYGIAFIGAGYSFNVLKTSAPAPLLGIPNSLLGAFSLAILLPSMIVLFCGKAVAIKFGRVKGESMASALSNGGLEVFERISQFLSNTISYVRLAIMLLIHAVLLQTVSYLSPVTNPLLIPAWIFFNLLILAFEALIVYVQDLRLHIYEFFTKFYRGTGTPFRKIFLDRVRIRINWL